MSKVTIKIPDGVDVSDGYHTFAELYDHRITLYLALCRSLAARDFIVWRSKTHSDGTSFPGWFVLGVGVEPGAQITYHLPLSKWDDANFANWGGLVPEFDGHTSADVLVRLAAL